MDIYGAIAGDRSAINMYTSTDCSRMVHFIFARIDSSLDMKSHEDFI